MDPYEVLGVSRDATEEEIKAAYRKLAREFHPDSHPDEDMSEQMSRINKAYQIVRTIGKEGEEAVEDWDIFGYTFENGHSPEEYRPGRRNPFHNPVFQKAVLFVIILSMLGINLFSIFFQALGGRG